MINDIETALAFALPLVLLVIVVLALMLYFHNLHRGAGAIAGIATVLLVTGLLAASPVISHLVDQLKAEDQPGPTVGPRWVWGVIGGAAAISVLVVLLRRWYPTAALRRRMAAGDAMLECADPLMALDHLHFFTADPVRQNRSRLAAMRATMPDTRLIRRDDAVWARQLCTDLADAWRAAEGVDFEANLPNEPQRRSLAVTARQMLAADGCTLTDRAVAARLLLAADLDGLPQPSLSTLNRWVADCPDPVWPTPVENLPGAVTEPATRGYQPYPSSSPWDKVRHWVTNRMPTTRRKVWEPTRSVTNAPEEEVQCG